MLSNFVELRYLSMDHNLVEGEDFEAINSTLTLMAGQPLINNITAGIVDDKRLEQFNESFPIRLEIADRPSFGTINIPRIQTIVIIQDDDG